MTRGTKLHISLRAHLVAGTAALGVTAIVVTPITQPDFSSAVQGMHSSIVGVALSGLHSPLTEAFTSAILATNYLLNPISPNITPTSNYWDYSGIGPIVQAALDNDLPFDPVTNALNTFQTLGVVPQIAADGLPVVTQLVTNASGYLTDAVINAFNDGTILSDAVWNLPGALIAVAQQVIAGNVSGALGTLQKAVIDPIVAVGQNVYGVGATIVGQVVSHVTNLVNALPGLAQIAAAHIVGTLNLLRQEVVRVASDTLTALNAGDAEGAWNALVDGVAGPSGLPGLIFNETIGAGVQTGPVSSASDIAVNFVPSIRSFLQTSVQTIAAAIGGPTGVAVPKAVASNTGRAAPTPRSAASRQPASAPAPAAPALKNRAAASQTARAHARTRART